MEHKPPLLSPGVATVSLTKVSFLALFVNSAARHPAAVFLYAIKLCKEEGNSCAAIVSVDEEYKRTYTHGIHSARIINMIPLYPREKGISRGKPTALGCSNCSY